MANKIVKVINTVTQEVFLAGIEWFNCNRKNHELYLDTKVSEDIEKYNEPLSVEFQEKLNTFKIEEPEVEIMIKKTRKGKKNG